MEPSNLKAIVEWKIEQETHPIYGPFRNWYGLGTLIILLVLGNGGALASWLGAYANIGIALLGLSAMKAAYGLHRMIHRGRLSTLARQSIGFEILLRAEEEQVRAVRSITDKIGKTEDLQKKLIEAQKKIEEKSEEYPTVGEAYGQGLKARIQACSKSINRLASEKRAAHETLRRLQVVQQIEMIKLPDDEPAEISQEEQAVLDNLRAVEKVFWEIQAPQIKEPTPGATKTKEDNDSD